MSRVESAFERLDAAQIRYSRSMYDPIFKVSREGGSLKLEMETEIEDLNIHYSFDGSIPDNYYAKYTKPLMIPHDATDVKVVTYRNGIQMGKHITMPVVEMAKRATKK